jgi:hypothetical protein
MFDPKRRPVFDIPRSGIDGFAADMDRTVDSIMRGRSLVYVRALNLLSEIVAGPNKVEAVIAGLEQAWGKKSFNIYYHRPLLTLAALRAEALAVDRHPLARALATENPDALAMTREALLQALSPGRSLGAPLRHARCRRTTSRGPSCGDGPRRSPVATARRGRLASWTSVPGRPQPDR